MSDPTSDYRGDSHGSRGQTISELIKKTIDYARKNYSRVLPVFLVAGMLNGLIFVIFLNPTSLPDVSSYSNLNQTELLRVAGQAVTALGFTWLEYLLSWFVLYFAAGVAIWQMSRERLIQGGDAGDSRPSLDYAKLGITTFVSALLISLGLFLVLIGAIFLGVMFYLVLPATVLEGRSAGSAISRSRHLVSGRWFKTFVLLAGWLLFAYIISGFVSALISTIDPANNTLNLISIFVGNFALALLFPFVAASMLVLYESSYSSMTTVSRTSPPPAPPSPYDSMKPEPMWPTSRDTMSYKYCPYCGASLTGQEKYCHNCGREIRS